MVRTGRTPLPRCILPQDGGARRFGGSTRRTQIDAATNIFKDLGPMAVPALLEALSQERSRPIRVHLVRMLAAIGDPALPEIQKHLRDKRWFFVR